jgi:uncharacterized protein YaaN involved in tellurite resistance
MDTVTVTTTPVVVPTIGNFAANEIIAVERMAATDLAKVQERAAKIDENDTMSIISFGVDSQRALTAQADTMIQNVRAKDAGPAGTLLNQLMLQVRGLGADKLNSGTKVGLFGKLLGHVEPIAEFFQKYETVAHQISDMQDKLETEKMTLLTDVVNLDKLYDATLGYYHDLEIDIAAGQMKLKQLNEVAIPSLQATATETNDLLDAQKLHDLVAHRDDLERKVHDLLLTRMITIQSLPQIKLTQDTDKGLVSKIQTSILTTIPVWKRQMALAITLYRQKGAVDVEKKVDDTTNQMIMQNAALLKQNTIEARTAMERGVFDVAAIQKANEDLIDTLQESVNIAEEGRQKRAEAEKVLAGCEAQLKQGLLAVRKVA